MELHPASEIILGSHRAKLWMYKCRHQEACLYIINWNHRDGSSGHLCLKAGVAVIPSDLGKPGSEHCIQTVWWWIFVFCLLMSDCPPSLRSSSSPPSSLLYTPFLPSPLPTFLVHRVQRTQLISFQKLNQLCGDETTCFSAVGQMLHVIVFRGQNLLSRCCSNFQMNFYNTDVVMFRCLIFLTGLRSTDVIKVEDTCFSSVCLDV